MCGESPPDPKRELSLMPPVHRYARPGSLVTVPPDVPDAVRWVLDDDWQATTWCGDSAEETFGTDSLHAVRTLHAKRRYPAGRIRVDAHALCLIRNLLDLETLNGCPECDDFAKYEGVEVDEYGYCGECHWCRCITLRDRLDYWLDRQGFGKSAYIDDVPDSIEDDWQRIYAGVPA